MSDNCFVFYKMNAVDKSVIKTNKKKQQHKMNSVSLNSMSISLY